MVSTTDVQFKIHINMKRRLNFTIEIKDNDLIQFNLEKLLYSIIGEDKFKDFRVLPNTDHLKDNEQFKALCKAEKKAKKLKQDFIIKNRK